jgi:hypothetical protein
LVDALGCGIMGVRTSRKSATLFAAFLVAATVTVSACAAECEGQTDPGPFVRLDVGAWFSAHPGTHLMACLPAHCADVPAGQTDVQVRQLSAPNAGQRSLMLRVTATRGGATILDTTSVVGLKQVTVSGACGFTELTRNVTLTAQGRLSVT